MPTTIEIPAERGERTPILGRLGLLRKRRPGVGSNPAGVGPVSIGTQSFAPVHPAPLPLRPLLAEYSATFGSAWRPLTRIKHRDDFARFIDYLETNVCPVTTASLDFPTLLAYVTDLRTRPRITGVWRGAPDALAQSRRLHPGATLSLNSVNAYMRPLRSLAIWLVDEGLLASNPFRRSRRRAALNPLLPSEETPTKSATLDDLLALERGCAGAGPLDLRDRAIVSILKTTAARNSSVRLLAIEDIDLDRAVIRFRRAKGGKTLEVALQPPTRAAICAYLERGRPALVGHGPDPARILFFARVRRNEPAFLSRNAISLMLTRRYHAGGGHLRSFGSHRIRHGTATMLVNNGMGLEEVSRYLGHSSTEPTRRYAQQTPAALGQRAADALERAGLV
jgi:site-specific recombinase XerD